jgi:hypothetical protein
MNALDKRGTIPLKGAAIGDGCWCVYTRPCHFKPTYTTRLTQPRHLHFLRGNEVGTCGFQDQAERINGGQRTRYTMLARCLCPRTISHRTRLLATSSRIFPGPRPVPSDPVHPDQGRLRQLFQSVGPLPDADVQDGQGGCERMNSEIQSCFHSKRFAENS